MASPEAIQLNSLLTRDPGARGRVRDILIKAAGSIIEEGVWCTQSWFQDTRGLTVEGRTYPATGTRIKLDEAWYRIQVDEQNLSLLAQMSRCAEGQLHLSAAQLGYDMVDASAASQVASQVVAEIHGRIGGYSSLVGYNDSLFNLVPHEAARQVANVFEKAADRVL